jgi:hypothetical protein
MIARVLREDEAYLQGWAFKKKRTRGFHLFVASTFRWKASASSNLPPEGGRHPR